MHDGGETTGDDLHAFGGGVALQGAWDVGDMNFPVEQGGEPCHVFRHPTELEFLELRRLAPVILHPLVEDVRADLALDELEGTRAHHLPSV